LFQSLHMKLDKRQKNYYPLEEDTLNIISN
jgi:hypothetical protein